MATLTRPTGFALALVAMLPTAAGGQTPPAASFAEEVSVGYVLVPVTVRSRRGLVTDLERDELRLLVDGEPVTIDWFERGSDAPIELVVMQDLSGSMALGRKLAASRELVGCLLDRLRAGDRYALASFAGRRMVVDVPYTTDRTAGREAMERWRPYGVTALHDAVSRLPEIRASGRTARAAVLLTDGAENASRMTAREAREVVRRAELPVYVMSLARPRAPDVEREKGSFAAILRQLASATGGLYRVLGGRQPVAETCGQVIEELRGRYVLGFPTAHQGAARWHELRLEIARRGLRWRSRRGYLGRPPETAQPPSVR